MPRAAWAGLRRSHGCLAGAARASPSALAPQGCGWRQGVPPGDSAAAECPLHVAHGAGCQGWPAAAQAGEGHGCVWDLRGLQLECYQAPLLASKRRVERYCLGAELRQRWGWGLWLAGDCAGMHAQAQAAEPQAYQGVHISGRALIRRLTAGGSAGGSSAAPELPA